jgi:hypothetical protein
MRCTFLFSRSLCIDQSHCYRLVEILLDRALSGFEDHAICNGTSSEREDGILALVLPGHLNQAKGAEFPKSPSGELLPDG